MIEVELRGFLTSDKYTYLLEFFKRHGSGLEDDSKTAHYFRYDQGILKIVDEKSQGKYKLSLKEGDEYKSLGMKETEIYLKSRSDYNTAFDLLESLGFVVKSTIEQQRTNVIYKEVQFALKYTVSWGYHFEAEMLVSDNHDIQNAQKHILDICSQLDIQTLTEAELQDFLRTLE